MTTEERDGAGGLQALCLGTKRGEGLSRIVYDWIEPQSWMRDQNNGVLEYDDERVDYVVKVQKNSHDLYFQNVQEWSVWQWVKAKPMAKWFAPCVAISPCGRYLIQRKCDPLRKAEMPKRLPAFLVDNRLENLGLFQGRVVCCDYGFGVAAIRTADKRLIKVREWPI